MRRSGRVWTATQGTAPAADARDLPVEARLPWWYDAATQVSTAGGGMAAARSIGVRELREHASEVLRRLRETGDEVLVTHRGRVIARLVPVPSPESDACDEEVWAEIDALAEEIAAKWQGNVSAVEAVREARRER